MSSDNDSVQDVLDSLDDLFEGAMAPHDEEPATPPSKAKSASAAPADEADAILDELLSGGTATGAPMPAEEEKPAHVHPGARDGAVLDDSLNTLIYDSAEEGLNVGHLNTSPTPPPPEEELPSTESLMEDDLLSDLLGESGFDLGPATPPRSAAAASPASEVGDADAILNELLGGGEPPGNEKPLDEFLAEQSAAKEHHPAGNAPDAATSEDADAILDDLLGESGAPSAEQPASPSADEADAILDGLLEGEPGATSGADDTLGGDEADAILDGLLGGDHGATDGGDDTLSGDEADAILDGLLGGGGTGSDEEIADADALLDELSAEMGASPPTQPASPLDTTDEILGDLLGEMEAAPKGGGAPAEAEPEMTFTGDEDALLNELLGGEEGAEGRPADELAGADDSDAILNDLLGEMDSGASASRDDEVEGLESLEDVFELGDGTITEKQPSLTGEPVPAPRAGEEAIPLLDDVVIPGDQLARDSQAPSTPTPPSALSSEQYDDLLNDLAGELQVRLAWRIEQQLKGAMERLIHDALEQASADLKESIQTQLKESLPSVLDRLAGK